MNNNNNNNNNKENKLKYNSLLYIEIKRMWNLKCTIIPVINGATGIVTRSNLNPTIHNTNNNVIHHSPRNKLHLDLK